MEGQGQGLPSAADRLGRERERQGVPIMSGPQSKGAKLKEHKQQFSKDWAVSMASLGSHSVTET